ncbi:uncharacterized protein VTP21DRAFT_2662 [Calcarisporiella thermophila]|uniref:uncharacterized protein n=1 Tax=Calcarisporiella thermophila TaxID=911321 RepID=UPI003743B550
MTACAVARKSWSESLLLAIDVVKTAQLKGKVEVVLKKHLPRFWVTLNKTETHSHGIRQSFESSTPWSLVGASSSNHRVYIDRSSTQISTSLPEAFPFLFASEAPVLPAPTFYSLLSSTLSTSSWTMIFVPVLVLILNIASIVCGGAMMSMVLWLRYVQPNIANTLSFKLSFWIGLADIFYRANFLLRRTWDVLDEFVSEHGNIARVLYWSLYAFPLWFAFLTMSVTFDLHLSFVFRLCNSSRLKRLYLPVSSVAAAVLPIPAAVVGNVWWDREEHRLINDWELDQKIWIELFCLDIWVGLAIAYSFLATIWVLVRLRSELRILTESQSYPNEPAEAKDNNVLHSVVRVLLYPVVLAICMPPTIVKNWLIIKGLLNSPLGISAWYAEAILSGAQGILNLGVFLLNPAVARAFSAISLLRREPSHEVMDNCFVPKNRVVVGFDLSATGQEPTAKSGLPQTLFVPETQRWSGGGFVSKVEP